MRRSPFGTPKVLDQIYNVGPSHVLPHVISVPQKKLRIGAELIHPNFHTDFKWCMWHSYVNPLADVWFFSRTRKIVGRVWRVQNYLCVETELEVKRDPIYFKNRTKFECTLT